MLPEPFTVPVFSQFCTVAVTMLAPTRPPELLVPSTVPELVQISTTGLTAPVGWMPTMPPTLWPEMVPEVVQLRTVP